MLDSQCDEPDTQDVERMAAEPSEGYEPQFMLPSAAYGEDEAEPDEHLLESGAAPDNGSSRTALKTDRLRACHISRVAYEGDEPIDGRGDMTRHPLERGCEIETEPGDLVTVLIADHGKFPEIVRHKQRDHKDDYVAVGL